MTSTQAENSVSLQVEIAMTEKTGIHAYAAAISTLTHAGAPRR